jgi:hypothetical protein
VKPAFLYSLAASLLIGIAGAALLRREGRSRSSLGPIALAGLTLALLMVGLVSHTFTRHVIQVTPPVVALALFAVRSPLAPPASIPLLTFWLSIMINIWLFLLGLARTISGTFTPTEIGLTIVVGAMCGLGLLGITRQSTAVGVAARIGIAAVIGCLQLGALLYSF